MYFEDLIAMEKLIFSAGVLAAIVSGGWAFRTYGQYGDGALALHLYRETDPRTGESVLVHDLQTSQGRRRILVDSDKGQLLAVQLDANQDGVPDAVLTSTEAGTVRVGFSLAGDAVIDAWAHRNRDGVLTLIEVSTRRDGRVDRWERYEQGLLVRVELDTNGNGKADQWQTFTDGILDATVIDANEDGVPDGRD
ncbi:MAG: hypothetical protein AMXMBFR57_28890 [Acidimicrobiia bacterium]